MKKTKEISSGLESLDSFIDRTYGKRGTAGREKFEAGYETFRLGFLLQEARLKRGLSQEELAMRVGTNKGYISKVENDLKEIRFSTLKRIVEEGLGGKLVLEIKL